MFERLNAAADIVLKRHQNPQLAALLLANSPAEDRQHALNWLEKQEDRDILLEEIEEQKRNKSSGSKQGRGSASQPLPKRQSKTNNPMEIDAPKKPRNVDSVESQQFFDANPPPNQYASKEAPAAIGGHSQRTESVNLLQTYDSMSQFLNEFLSRANDQVIEGNLTEFALDNAAGALGFGGYSGFYYGPIDDNLRVVSLKVVILVCHHASLGPNYLRNRGVHDSLDVVARLMPLLTNRDDIEGCTHMYNILHRYKSARASSCDSLEFKNNPANQFNNASAFKAGQNRRSGLKQAITNFKEKMKQPFQRTKNPEADNAPYLPKY